MTQANELFRRNLQEELLKRCKANPRYSLRGFAQSLDVAPSALSSIMNRKRPLSQKMKLRLGFALGLKSEDILSDKAPTAEKRNYRQINLDTLSFISEWYYDAILELINLPRFKPSRKTIAAKLGLTQSEANIAVEKLERLGLIKIEKPGKQGARN